MEEKAKRSGREQERRPPRQAAAGRQRQAGRHGRGFPRAFPYIAQKGGGRPARRIGSTAGGEERQRARQETEQSGRQ